MSDYLKKAKEVLAKSKNQAAHPPAEPVYDREHRLVVFSRVLERDIIVSWTGPNPKVVYVERIPYTVEEITEVKNIAPEGIRKIHLIKKEFEGKVE